LGFDAARRADSEAGPGLVVLGARDEVELIPGPARELLDQMRSPALVESDDTAPVAVRAVAASARAGMTALAVTVPGRSGWISLHASLPGGQQE
jgi:hypothetical protein